jgi:hypothetical protein
MIQKDTFCDLDSAMTLSHALFPSAKGRFGSARAVSILTLRTLEVAYVP